MTTVLKSHSILIKKRVIKLHFQRVNNSNRLEDRIMVAMQTLLYLMQRVRAVAFMSLNRDIKRKVKLQRAQGECLGTGSRRRTWLTAISLGEP